MKRQMIPRAQHSPPISRTHACTCAPGLHPSAIFFTSAKNFRLSIGRVSSLSKNGLQTSEIYAVWRARNTYPHTHIISPSPHPFSADRTYSLHLPLPDTHTLRLHPLRNRRLNGNHKLHASICDPPIQRASIIDGIEETEIAVAAGFRWQPRLEHVKRCVYEEVI